MNLAQSPIAAAALPEGGTRACVIVLERGPQWVTAPPPDARPSRSKAQRDKPLGAFAARVLRVLARQHARGTPAITSTQIAQLLELQTTPQVCSTLNNLRHGMYAECLHDGWPSRWQVTPAGIRKAARC